MALQLPRGRLILAIAIALLAGLAIWIMTSGADAGHGRAEDKAGRPPLALFTTMPIYWNESADLSSLLSEDQEPHWARSRIELERSLTPLDTLGSDNLAPFSDLLMAQPRPLSPAENVALDGWVRSGGRLLLFADPMLTAHSQFGIGDRRRPQDVVLLSPILSRWGLQLKFDASQAAGEHFVELAEANLPVDLPGRLVLVPTAPDAPADCRLTAAGLLADCSIGQGRAVILADAALLDGDGADTGMRSEALAQLMAQAFEAD